MSKENFYGKENIILDILDGFESEDECEDVIN